MILEEICISMVSKTGVSHGNTDDMPEKKYYKGIFVSCFQG